MAPTADHPWEDQVSSGQRFVGEPTHERRLMRSLSRSAGSLFHPGVGRTAWIVLEPQVGAGRPDAVVITASSAALAWYRASGLRLATPSAAKVLMDGPEDALGLSRAYVRELRKSLSGAGWDKQTYLRAASIVFDSIAIEAKMTDWRGALRQVGKFRVTVHRSAILMPVGAAQRIARPTLELFRTGVLAEAEDQVTWQSTPGKFALNTAGRAWLLEILVRGLEAGSAYKLSEFRNFTRADFSASTLGR